MSFGPNDYKVNFRGRTGISYTEGAKTIMVDSELIFGPPGVTIYSDSIDSWDPPFANEKVSDHDRRRIIANIKRDLERHGYRVDIA